MLQNNMFTKEGLWFIYSMKLLATTLCSDGPFVFPQILMGNKFHMSVGTKQGLCGCCSAFAVVIGICFFDKICIFSIYFHMFKPLSLEVKKKKKKQDAKMKVCDSWLKACCRRWNVMFGPQTKCQENSIFCLCKFF